MTPERAQQKRVRKMKVLEDTVVGALRQMGSATRADLYDISRLPSAKLDVLIKRIMDIHPVISDKQGKVRYYRWVGVRGRVLIKPQLKPCLGGCGAMVLRDGNTFMCKSCRQKATTFSALAI